MTAATLSVSEERCLQVAINIMDKYMQIARGEIDGYDPLAPCPEPIDLSFDYIPRYAVEMKKKPIDIIDIKKAVADGQLVAFEKDYQIFIKDKQTGEVVKIGDIG